MSFSKMTQNWLKVQISFETLVYFRLDYLEVTQTKVEIISVC